MKMELSLIAGIMLGCEFVQDPEDGTNYFVIDCLFVRVLFGWG
jgi:hypothetical protein